MCLLFIKNYNFNYSQDFTSKKQTVEKINKTKNEIRVAPILQNYKPPEPKMLPNMRRIFQEQRSKGMSPLQINMLKYNSDYSKRLSDIPLNKKINNEGFVAWT